MLLENELEGNEFMTVERLRHVQERLRERARHWKDYALTLLKWVLFALLVGISVGFVGALFHMAIDRGTELRESHKIFLFLLPLAGLVIVWAYHVTGMSDD